MNEATLISRGRAEISPCGQYRYLLSREVSQCGGAVTFIMLNPSTADASNDDPTIRRCIGFARKWGCGTLFVVNLFGRRATDPAALRTTDDPVGPDNKSWLLWAVDRCVGDAMYSKQAYTIVCAWGTHGTYMDQDRTVLGWLDEVSVKRMALGITKEGHPRHPLYVRADAPLIDFRGRP